MITIIDSFAVQYRPILPIEEDCKIFNQFSLGVLDRRYPKGSPKMIDSFSLSYTEEVEFEEARFIRVK